MDIDWSGISHVTKIDPAKRLPSDLEVLEGTDLVVVGGSDGVTEGNVIETVDRLVAHGPDVPILQEPYSSDHVTKATIDRIDYLAIPAVYNGDFDHFVGKHLGMYTELASKPRELLGSSLPVVGNLLTAKGVDAVETISTKLVGEGYVVQHLDSAAAETAGVTRRFTADEVAGAALATETFYGFPIFYVEYSGTYGGPADVEAARTYLEDTVLLYGGGIDDGEKTAEILDAGADAVVVGDIFHDDVDRYRQTIPSH